MIETDIASNASAAQDQMRHIRRDEILMRYLALRDAAKVAARLSGEVSAQNDERQGLSEIAARFSLTNDESMERFERHCRIMTQFLSAGLTAIQAGRAQGRFNPAAAYRLYCEFNRTHIAAWADIKI